MTYQYRSGRRRASRGSLVLLLVLISVFLVSCVAGSNSLWVRGLLGIDFADYHRESVLGEVPVDGAVSAQLCDMVDILTLEHQLSLKPFSSTTQAVKYYRDAILNDMLRDDYQLYTGSHAQPSDRANLCQPTISMMIPTEDFENAVFRYFGGTTVQHRDGEIFRYMRQAGGYTTPVQARDPATEVRVVSIVETAHTYRMTFYLEDEGAQSSEYLAVFVKREDSSCYFYSLRGL